MPYLTGDDPGAATVCRVLYVPDDQNFIAAVNGALYELTKAYNWEQQGDLTPDEAAAIAADWWLNFVDSECPTMPDYDLDRTGDLVQLKADGDLDTEVDISDKVADTGDTMTGPLNIYGGSNTKMRIGQDVGDSLKIIRNTTSGNAEIQNPNGFLKLVELTSNMAMQIQTNSIAWIKDTTTLALISSQGLLTATQRLALRLNSSTAWRDAARVEASWADSTDATRRGTMALGVYKQTTAQIAMLASADDSGEPKLSFRGENPIARPTLTGDVSPEVYDLAQALDDLGLVDNQFEIV